jgi:opacity protein-like surface antigen
MDVLRVILFVRYTLFFLVFVPALTLANNGSASLLNKNQYLVGLDLGAAKPTNLGNATTFPLGYSHFSYSSSHNDARALISGISLNKTFTLVPLYTLQVGVSFHHIVTVDAKGDLEQGISPPWYQSTYSYSVHSSQFLAEAKLRREFCNRYFPYVYLGLGVASNRAYDYSTDVPNYLTATPDYNNRTTTSFAYSLGIGIDYFIVPKLSIGLGYRFIDLGNVGLGTGIIRKTPVKAELTQSNLYINSLLAQLNYYFM